MAAVKRKGMDLQHVLADLNDDEEVVWEAIQRDIDAFYYASDRVKSSEFFIKKAIDIRGDVLIYASHNLRDRPEIICYAAKNNMHMLRYASNRLKATKIFMMEFIAFSTIPLDYVADFLGDDEHFMHQVISIHPVSHGGHFASARLKVDHAFMIDTIKINREFIRCAADSLRSDYNFVKDLVAINPSLLDYAAASLTHDNAFMAKAIATGCGAGNHTVG